MCAVIIHDQVDGKTAGKTGVDVVQKPQELLVTMPPVTVADGDSARHIQGRKQRCHTMTFVIMRLPGRPHRAPAEESAAYGSALGLDSSHPRTARSHDPADSYTTPRCPAPSPRTAGLWRT